MGSSAVEQQFEGQLQQLGIKNYEREHHFHPTRKWRFDFAWPQYKLAVEIEGAVWTRGRHTRGSGFIKDAEKYNAAVEEGWRVLRMPTPFVQDGRAIAQVERVLLEEFKRND